MNPAPFTLAVIAGGKSRRMGTDKAFVPLMGKPLLAHVLDRTASLGQSETILIANDREKFAAFGLPVYADVLPNCGALGGIYTALYTAKTPIVIMLACDLPFVSAPLLRHMLTLTSPDIDAVVPYTADNPEPLYALYHKTCLPTIYEHLQNGQLKASDIFNRVRVKAVDTTPFDHDGATFTNINTPDDLARAEILLSHTPTHLRA